MRGARTLVGIGAAALVVLLARTIAYAVEPSPAARALQQSAGGPGLPVLTLVSLSLGAAVAIAICWLAALGVRERAFLESRPVRAFRVRRTFALAVALASVTTTAGGLLEAYIHWRAGLGWHGLHCLLGPVHRDLIPLETTLSLVAAAVLEAASHVVSWMRRTFALLRSLPPRVVAGAPTTRPSVLDVPWATLRRGMAAPRAPPALS